jgi:hypothetical protein
MRDPAIVAAIAVACLAVFVPVAMSQGAGEPALPEGTKIALQLNDYLSTKLNHEGDSFTATVLAPVTVGDRIVVPKGSVVTGMVGRIVRPGRFRGKAVMNLVFQSIRVSGHGETPIVAMLAGVRSEDAPEVKSEGTLQGEGSKGRDSARVLSPAASGAGVGALGGGGRGAAIGAGVGAVVGLATVFATRGKDLEMRRGVTLDIALERPLNLTAEHDSHNRRIQE